ncbi:hypothetical protein [Kitasatospora sp. NPDC097643]|uniref:hypothetical protein n=1 Tax=Kitasatospora sp. NPDC097643 TaxID=3157230 RepID=UPI00333388CE
MEHPAQQYYNPHLTAAEERALLRRNYLLLQTGQAALGLIGPGMLGIAVEARSGVIVIHFAIANRTAEIEEDIDDIIFDVEAFLSGGPEHHSQIASQVHVGQSDSTWPGRSHALLYLAKSPAE